MRSINLIGTEKLRLEDLERCARRLFADVTSAIPPGLADREGLSSDEANTLTLALGEKHIIVLRRPTTIREYDANEVDAIQRACNGPINFYSVDYNDDSMLHLFLRTLDGEFDDIGILVDPDDGSFPTLSTFVSGSDG